MAPMLCGFLTVSLGWQSQPDDSLFVRKAVSPIEASLSLPPFFKAYSHRALCLMMSTESSLGTLLSMPVWLFVCLPETPRIRGIPFRPHWLPEIRVAVSGQDETA